MRLSTFERQNDTPGGKKKIYITGEPGSRGFLINLAEIIIDVCECRCFIDDDLDVAEMRPQEREMLIGQMDIAVFAVTRGFLTKPGLGREFDLPCATENGISILPLVFENDLESMFSRICGHFQALSVTPETISVQLRHYFTEKFDTEYRPLVQREDPFSARAFLSYRKTDRLEAVKLMQQVNDISFCVNTSIWFDDYLKKGEDYDADIDNALRACDYVILLVTPALFARSEGAPNYVEGIEYPNALKYHKRIVAVEAEPVDHDEFRMRFPEAYLVPYGDREALEKVLFNIYEAMGVPIPPKMSTNLIYELAGAYMDGRGVPKNTAKACYLYSLAGDNGCSFAYGMLGKYYEERSSSDQDRLKAIEYYDKMICIQLKEVQKLTSSYGKCEMPRQQYCELYNLGSSCGNAMISLNSILFACEKWKELVINCNDLQLLCKMLWTQEIVSEKINIGVPCLTLGIVSILCKDRREEYGLVSPLTYFEKSEEWFVLIKKDTYRYNENYMQLYYWRGNAYFDIITETGDISLIPKACDDLIKALACVKWINEVYNTEYDTAVAVLYRLFMINSLRKSVLKNDIQVIESFRMILSECNRLSEIIELPYLYYIKGSTEFSLALLDPEALGGQLMREAIADAQKALKMEPDNETFIRFVNMITGTR